MLDNDTQDKMCFVLGIWWATISKSIDYLESGLTDKALKELQNGKESSKKNFDAIMSTIYYKQDNS